MEIECFDEIFNMLYIAKKLYDLDRYNLVSENFPDVLEYDAYYDAMYGLIDGIFEYSECCYYENRNFEIHVLSDAVIVDFYTLAGEYGEYNNILDIENPYIKEAHSMVGNQLSFSYCLDFMLMEHTNPKRPFHSRLGLIISHDDCVELGVLAYRLIEIHEWYKNKCDELTIKLKKYKPLPGQTCLEDLIYKEAIAA